MDATNKARRKDIREYHDWLDTLQLPKTMQTAAPEDLAVYFTQHWLLTHVGAHAGKGQYVTAPGSLASVIPFLCCI